MIGWYYCSVGVMELRGMEIIIDDVYLINITRDF
jgi:hypothetical protein